MADFEAFVESQKYVTVSTSFFLSRLSNLKKLCEEVKYSAPLAVGFSVEELVVSEIKKAHRVGAEFSVLASGGADSTFLISILAKRFPAAKITAFFGKTANNEVEGKAVDILCQELGVGVEKIVPNIPVLESQLTKFIEKYKRTPRDVAQPLHNAIVEKIRLLAPNSVIIDGQYADTLMFANPQNVVFDFWKIVGGTSIVNKTLTRLSVINSCQLSSGRVGIIDIPKSIVCDAATLIIWLCRLDESGKTRDSVNGLLGLFPAALVMQVVFYEVLLAYREADKYLLCPEVISPFNNTMLMIDAWQRKKMYNNLIRRKKPIWDYISSRHPKVHRYVRRRSFEPT